MNQPAGPQGQNMNINFHQQKLYSLILGGVALIGLILPWVVVSYGFGNIGGGASGNGFNGWGYLSFLGVIGIVVASLLGDKMQMYDQNMKMVAMGSFGAIGLGAIIVFIKILNAGSTSSIFGSFGAKAGIGLWLNLIAGILGLLWIMGIIKLPAKTPPPPPPAN